MTSPAARRGVVAAIGAVLALGWGLPAPSAARPASAEPSTGGAAAARRSWPGARAAVVFLPWPSGDRSLLRELADRGLAIGSTSATVGGYAPEQALLDLSQGARLPLGAYPGPPPRLSLAVGAGGSPPAAVSGWGRATGRARVAPGEVVPGLLGEAARGGGAPVTYVGPRSERNPEAAVAADRRGAIVRVALAGDSALASRAVAAWGQADLLVVRAPAGKAGLGTLDRLLAARRPADLLCVMRAPPAGTGRPAMLASALAAPGSGAGEAMASATTRRPGLVASVDVAPTVLEALGVGVPYAMQGEAIRLERSTRPAAVLALHDRLVSVLARRRASLAALGFGWLVVVGALARARGSGGARAGVRIGLLAALWYPTVSLATAALAPSSVGLEAAVLAVAALALAALTDRLVPWPGGPALPAASAWVAYAVDLGAGSGLTPLAVSGPNPAAGARFYGVGNELETLLGLSLLIGVGAAAAAAHAGKHATAVAFGGAGALGALVLGAGRLGADVGAVFTVGAGCAAAAACALPRGRTRRAGLALVLLGPLAGLAALVALDLVTGGGAHLSRSIDDARGASRLLEVARRRTGTQIDLLASPGGAAIAIACLGTLAAGVRGRAVILRPLRARGGCALAAAIVGSAAATLAGTLGNDSPTDVLAIGTVLLVLAVGYARSPPPPSRGTFAAGGTIGER